MIAMTIRMKGVILLTMFSILLGSCCKDNFEIPVKSYWVFVSNADGDNISVIDASTNHEALTIDASSMGFNIYEPRNSAISHDGKLLYVPCRHSDNVLVINVESPQLLANVTDTSFDEPYAVAFTGDDSEAWVVNKQGGGSWTGNISIINTATQSVEASIEDGNLSSPEGIAIANGKAYVANRGDGSVTIYDVNTRTFVKNISTGGEPRYALASPDQSRVYVTNAGGLAVINTSTDNVETTLNIWGRNLGISPDGKKLFIGTQWNNILIVSITNYQVDTLNIPNAWSIYDVAISSKGDLGYATDEDRDVVYVFNPQTNTLINNDTSGTPLKIPVGATPRGIVAN